ncbi:hypothetical protein BLNAU_16743 [Blattamonas nauphoetae]|uniref:Uncharacterized protein n=1 Tax=Blattamonas nauphoetae TaxID=2049346 RepID=A0ABQ9XBQ2_9EUKA|nr:hypothetical protein BLNAU_16743 [Blattamonas nauphoetae]
MSQSEAYLDDRYRAVRHDGLSCPGAQTTKYSPATHTLSADVPASHHTSRPSHPSRPAHFARRRRQRGTLPPQPRPTLMMIKRRARSGGSTAFSDFPRHKFPTAGTTPASIAVARFSDASQISVDDEIFTNRVQRVLEQ